MNEATLGINQRIPLDTLDFAVRQFLQGIQDFQSIEETLKAQFQGTNRAAKGVQQIKSMLLNNPSKDFLYENKENILSAMKTPSDRNLILSAISSARFSLFYDILTVLGKQFRIQDDVSSDLLKRLMSVKYGANKSFENKIYMAVPQMVEAELFIRPKVGLYQFIEPQTAHHRITFELWKESYFANEPLANRESEDYIFHPYFRFIKYDG